jgi:hypothetical protein
LIDLRSTEGKPFTVELFRGRLRWVFVALSVAGLGLVVRAADLQLFDFSFDDGRLLKEGNARLPASPSCPHIAARRMTAMAKRWRSARRWTRCGSSRTTESGRRSDSQLPRR